MFGTSVCFTLNNLEGPTHTKVESKISLRIIGEDKFLNHIGGIVIGDGPVFNPNVFAAVHFSCFV